MEDRDWTDLPSTSSALRGIDESYITDSSPEIIEKKKQLSIFTSSESQVIVNESAGITENDNKSEVDVRNKTKDSLNDKQEKEKESCPICLSSFKDRSFLDQCFHIHFIS